SIVTLFVLLLPPRPPRCTLFPYTTLFRSLAVAAATVVGLALAGSASASAASGGADTPSQKDIFSAAAWGLFHPGSAPPGTNDWSDRKSTRLNSSHLVISYAVFCLKKKKKP